VKTVFDKEMNVNVGDCGTSLLEEQKNTITAQNKRKGLRRAYTLSNQ
jgi:hypothetical protein